MEVVAEGVGVRTTALRVVCCQLKLWLWAWPLSLEALFFLATQRPKEASGRCFTRGRPVWSDRLLPGRVAGRRARLS